MVESTCVMDDNMIVGSKRLLKSVNWKRASNQRLNFVALLIMNILCRRKNLLPTFFLQKKTVFDTKVK